MPNDLSHAQLNSRVTLAVLRQLVALREDGSLGAVARRLGVSQPTISSNLARLEDAVGVPLILRGSGGSTLTTAGAAVAKAACTVIGAADDLARTIDELTAVNATPLSIAASLTIAEHLVPRWLADDRIAHLIEPGQATLKVGNSDEVMTWVVADQADVGFVEGNRFHEGLAHRLIGRDELVVVVGPPHRWFSGRPRIDASELVNCGLVLRERGSGTREVLEDALARTGVSLPSRLPSFGSTAAILTAVRYGGAAGVISRLAVTDLIEAGEVSVLEVADASFVRNLSAVWREGASLRIDAAGLVTNVATLWARRALTADE